jgi:hypothetical protein
LPELSHRVLAVPGLTASVIKVAELMGDMFLLESQITPEPTKVFDVEPKRTISPVLVVPLEGTVRVVIDESPLDVGSFMIVFIDMVYYEAKNKGPK